MLKQMAATLAGVGLEKARKAAKEFISSQAESWMDLKNNPEKGIREQYEKIKNQAQEDREGIFGSMWETGGELTQSWFHRQFPLLAKLYGGYEALGELKSDEKIPWEHELQIFGAFSIFIPDFLLRWATDPLKNKVLLPILESGLYPGAESILDNLYSDDNPDQVIDALITMNQDIVTGTVSMEGIWQNLIKKVI